MSWHDPLGVDTCPYPTVLIGGFGCAVMAQDRRQGMGLPQNDVDFALPEFPRYSEYGDVYALALTVVWGLDETAAAEGESIEWVGE
jgi:hypothetical protein